MCVCVGVCVTYINLRIEVVLDFALIILCIQAFVISEDESEALNSDEGTFQFLHKLLSGALQVMMWGEIFCENE